MSSKFIFNKEYKLSDLVDFVNQKISSTKVTLDTYISTDNMIVDRGGVEAAKKLPSASKYNHFKTSDTLFSNIRTYFRKIWFAEFEGGSSPDVLIFRTKDPEILDPTYLYYLLSKKKFSDYTVLTSKGVKMPRGDKTAIMQYKVYLPEPHIQNKVGKYLRAYDLKIKNNTQSNQTLEQIAQALFKSWFVDFDPVKAKIGALNSLSPWERAGVRAKELAELAAMGVISAKTPEQLAELKKSQPDNYAQLAETAALFPSAMQESELGDIPEGWDTKPFVKLLEKTIGGDWGKEASDEKHTEKVRILRGTDLPSVHAGNNSRVPVRYVDKKKLKTRKLKDGDIVIEVSGGSPTQPTGRSLFISQKILDGLMEPAEPASFCRLFRPLNVKVGLFLSCHLTKIYADGKTWLYQNQSTGISNFQTKTFLEKELLVMPEPNIMDVFINSIRPIFDRIHNGENKELSTIRETLIPKLLSGEIDLSASSEKTTRPTYEP